METFSALLGLCVGNSAVTVNSPYKGQWRGDLMFSLISAWINGWVNNGDAGDLRRHRAYYDVIVIKRHIVSRFIPHTFMQNAGYADSPNLLSTRPTLGPGSHLRGTYFAAGWFGCCCLGLDPVMMVATYNVVLFKPNRCLFANESMPLSKIAVYPLLTHWR